MAAPAAAVTNVSVFVTGSNCRSETPNYALASGEIVVTAGPDVPLAQCSVGTDDDADGLSDYPADPGCQSAQDTTEAPNTAPPAVGPTWRERVVRDLQRPLRSAHKKSSTTARTAAPLGDPAGVVRAKLCSCAIGAVVQKYLHAQHTFPESSRAQEG
jgi:hypothetical protein